MRLNVFLQKAGVGSRREAERMVAEGRVKINGVVALATTPAEEGDVITLDGKPVAPSTKPLPRLMNVGRLDVNSEGLLLLSSDGPLAQALMSPETALSRIYRVRVRGHLRPEDIATLADGIVVDGVNYRGAEFVEEYDGSGRSNTWYRVVLTEGKNREIRKLMEHFGCVVNRLIRVQYGPFYLGKLQSGALEEIEPARVAELLKYLQERGVKV
jgi:23S rRNA pseudouridine2605 synthase